MSPTLLESAFTVSQQIPLRPKSIAASSTLHRPSLLFRTETRPRRLPVHALIRNKVNGLYTLSNPVLLSFRSQGMHPIQDATSVVSCTVNMTAGTSDDPERFKLDHAMGEIRKVLESLPQPVRTFPWMKVLENFLELILGLLYAVAKYLSVPLLGISSLSEMSYCAHERKMRLIPVPALAGFAVAGALRDTILDLYPHLKEKEYPWHLVTVASFFVLLKLPGPYYPYWGRILIPHLANGGLWRTLWFTFLWYRRPREATQTTSLQSSTSDHHLDEES